jgi:predicted small lipoprotein YifL
MRMIGPWAGPVLALAVGLVPVGCGQRGPLYLPGMPEGESRIADALGRERDRARELEIENDRLRDRIRELEREIGLCASPG